MNIDCAFTIGQGHTVCQDYATVFSPDKPLAIVCDGCSSSPMTDVGARFLAHSLINLLYDEHYLSIDELVYKLRSFVFERHPLEFLTAKYLFDSTLLFIRESPDNDIEVTVIGDGLIVFKRADSVYGVIDIDYENFPRYLSYEFDVKRRLTYESSEHQASISKYIINGTDIEKTVTKIGLKTVHNTYKFVPSQYEWIGICTDGIHSFSEGSYLDVIHDLFNFKTYTGQFVKRRLKRFIKEYNSQGITHHDDLGLAVWYLGDRQ